MDCKELLKSLVEQEEAIDKNTQSKIDWLINRINEIRNYLEDAHAFLKEDNIPECINELLKVNRIITKNIEAF